MCHTYGVANRYVVLVILAHRIRLVPNKEQEQYFYRASGVARFAYNWALVEWERLYALGEPRSDILLRRKLNAIKDEQFPWMREVTKNAPQQAIKNLGRAFAIYVENVAKARRGELPWNRVGRPQFKRKGVHDSFRADNGPCKGRPAVRFSGRRIRLPRIGWIKMREELRYEGEVLSAQILRRADRWYVVLTVRIPDPAIVRTDCTIAGCDAGLTTLATIFDGCEFQKVTGVRPLHRYLKSMRRLNRSLLRKQKGSRNRAKARTKLARLHNRISDIRHDMLHKLTTGLVRSYRTIGIETLNLRGMLRNRRTARSVGDVAFGEFRRQLLYKARIHGATIVSADRWFPSSKLCSVCGNLENRVVWAVRAWTCSVCEAQHDRDENAARNLYLAASSAVKACGAEGAGRLIRDGETGRYEAGRSAEADRNGAEIAGSLRAAKQ